VCVVCCVISHLVFAQLEATLTEWVLSALTLNWLPPFRDFEMDLDGVQTVMVNFVYGKWRPPKPLPLFIVDNINYWTAPVVTHLFRLAKVPFPSSIRVTLISDLYSSHSHAVL